MCVCMFVFMYVYSSFGAWMQQCADKKTEVWDDDDNEREVKRNKEIEKYKWGIK
jgi:hypothetical protein